MGDRPVAPTSIKYLGVLGGFAREHRFYELAMITNAYTLTTRDET